MANLRVLSINSADSRTIKASFTNDLNLNLQTGNVVVESKETSVPNPTVLSIRINGPILIINTMAMTPYARYSVTFQSTDTVRFSDVSGNSFLFEDGKTNVLEILGAENPDNSIRDSLITYLKDQIYDEGLAHGKLIRLILDNISTNMLKSRFDINQLRSDNYLSFQVTNERKVRGYGPWDRLGEEGAYEILRVSKNEQNSIISRSQAFESFPSDPITLQAVVVNNEVLEAANSGPGFNSFLLTTTKSPVTILKSVRFAYSDGSSFTYDVTSYGYKIKDPRYDTSFASTFVSLNDNQFQLNTDLLEDPTFVIPGADDTIIISYEYKNLGLTVEDGSVAVTNIVDAVREPVPPLLTQFTLDHAPIILSNGNTSGGVEFLDPVSTTPFRSTHPAFTKEVPFNLGGLPKNTGEYSVDYATGRVVVYGAEKNDGTGYYPPAASYTYRKFFIEDLDYFYSPEFIEVVSSPLRDLRSNEATLSYQVQQNLIPNIDYKAEVHKESLNERIQNRLKTTGSLETLHGPITNVFRIFNETSQEVYGVSRWNDSTAFFTYNTPPNIIDATRERPSFANVTNELLILSSEFRNSSNIRILKIQLLNENIMSATEDVIGSSYNSSVVFSRSDIFNTQLYYDGQILSEDINTDRLIIGYYQVDFRSGIVYVGVSDLQDLDLGTISYKKPVISPNNPHIIAVSEIYYSLNPASGKSKLLNYSSFGDGAIYPTSFDISDERFLNNDVSNPYLFVGNTITVADDIKAVRHVFDVDDLNSNVEPIDFGPVSTWDANIITIEEGISQVSSGLVVSAGLEVTVPTISNGIVLFEVNSVVRVADGYELLDGYQTLSDNTITLSSISGAVPGDVVRVIYTVILNGAATPVVDYNRGDYFIDYTYLADEILISYEYGDNVVDFREFESLNPGDTYFVSYKAGALRDALLSNFGSLVAIPEVQVFDVDLNRERYRDVLIGALQSFTKGPTIESIKLLVSNMTKIDPIITESVFQVWSLGISYLNQQRFVDLGSPSLVAGKFDQGISINSVGQAVSFPVSSNLRIEEGSLEMWVIPEWDGLANDATLTFVDLARDGYELDTSEVWIGASSYHPESIDFSLSRNDSNSPDGLPAAIHTEKGLFIYFDTDDNKWKVIAKDVTADGYTYTGRIDSSGAIYDARKIVGLLESTDSIRTTERYIKFTLKIDAVDALSPDGYSTIDGYVAGYSFDGIGFMADDEHYLFDFAQTADKNRFSLYKDGRGYLVFKVWDRGESKRRNTYAVSADIRNWAAGIGHHVGISWKLNTSERRDEMHIFIDGVEQPNIIKYGGIPSIASTNRFRTVVPELVVGTVPKTAVVGNDLVTVQGSSIVYSETQNFGALGIVPTDTIEIREQGFATYTILSVSGNELILNANMPASLSDASFSVNPYSVTVGTQIDLYTNIAVSSLYLGEEEELPGLRAEIPAYTISRNTVNENVLTILGDVEAGSQILIKTLGLNHRRCRDKIYLWSDSAILRTAMPPPINLDDVIIRPVPLIYTVINPNDGYGTIEDGYGPTDGYVIVSGGHFLAQYPLTQISNALEGRHVEIRITGGNVDFSTPTYVTINGTSAGGSSEILTFTAPGTQISTNKWKTLSTVDVDTVPLNIARNGVGIEIKEAYSVTDGYGNYQYATIRFAFQRQSGISLQANGTEVVSDVNSFFSTSDVGNVLVIEDPPSGDGYKIIEKIDDYTVRLGDILTSAPASIGPFTNGKFKIYDVSIGRSGFQNGFFYVENAGFTKVPFPLPMGFVEFDYAAYLEVPFDPIDQTAYIGNDFTGTKPADAIIDEFRILNRQITDIRTGEIASINTKSFTKSYQAIRPFAKDSDTLVLLHFEELPPTNDADFWVFANREYIQSGESVNEKFNKSLVIKNKGISFTNNGRLNTSSEGAIEFWVSPRFDTYNDPVPRVYFDAAASVTEEVTSLTKATLEVSGRARQILSVRLISDVDNTGKNFYAAGGTLQGDAQTIKLKAALPFQQTQVKVSYIPTGQNGDRITLLKNYNGYMTMLVTASGVTYEVAQPVFWPRDTWHRVRASWKFNRVDNRDEIRLFVDGEERGLLIFGSGLLFGSGAIFGQSVSGVTNQILRANMDFTDTIPEIHFGYDYTGSYGAQARLDNIKLSDTAMTPLTIGNQPFDFNFNTNSDYAFPAIEDAFTTMLLDFDSIASKNEDFAILRDPAFGIFNFALTIIDSFDIVMDDPRLRSILEAMIRALKPANAKVEIDYIK